MRLGWVLGTAPCAAPRPCLALLRTDDAGHTWARIGTPPEPYAAPPAAPTGVGFVRFADARDGWLFAPDLWSTHDGGAHWGRVSLPGVSANSQVSRLEAAAGSVHAAVLDLDAGVVAIETAAVATESWQRSPTTVVLGAGPVPDAQLVLQGADGWIVENDRGVVGGARYHDGRWAPWQPPCTMRGSAVIAASTPSDLLAVCDEGAWNSVPRAVHAYSSRDGGATFQRAAGSLPIGAGSAVASAGPGQAVISADAPGRTQLLLTRDGGATTTPVYQGVAAFVGELGFTTSQQGVVVISTEGRTGALLMTYDGGRSWKPVAFVSAPL